MYNVKVLLTVNEVYQKTLKYTLKEVKQQNG
jgi:hypothetical protein